MAIWLAYIKCRTWKMCFNATNVSVTILPDFRRKVGYTLRGSQNYCRAIKDTKRQAAIQKLLKPNKLSQECGTCQLCIEIKQSANRSTRNFQPRGDHADHCTSRNFVLIFGKVLKTLHGEFNYSSPTNTTLGGTDIREPSLRQTKIQGVF